MHLGFVQELLGTAEEEHEDVDWSGHVHDGHIEEGLLLTSGGTGAKEVRAKHRRQVVQVHLVQFRVGCNSSVRACVCGGGGGGGLNV